jgi:hypothetical protein
VSQDQAKRPQTAQQPAVKPAQVPAQPAEETSAQGGGRRTGRNKNKLEPHPEAAGPHSTFKRDPNTGKVTNYETYQKQTNPKNPSPWELQKRYDGAGGGHYIPSMGKKVLPHVHDATAEDGVRVPTAEEIPK